jgi:hypothetical protein
MAPAPINRPHNTQKISQRIQLIDNTTKINNSTYTITSFPNSNPSDVTQLPSDITNQPRRFPVKISWVGGAILLLGLAGYSSLPGTPL